MPGQDNYTIFSGSSHCTFAQKIATLLGKEIGSLEMKKFPDGEIGVRILENVRGRDVFVIQSIAVDPNFYLMETLILIDALKRASAQSITAVIPYLGYCRQDRKNLPREPITARLVANLLEVAGIDRLLTMDLHTEQIEGFFNVPVDNLYASGVQQKILFNSIKEDFTVVVPDIGSIKIARRLAEQMGKKLAIIDKRRLDASHVHAQALIGEISTKSVLLVDDLCTTGNTLLEAARTCQQKGAEHIYAMVTHLLQPLSPELEASVKRFFVCDTISQNELSSKVEIVSVASLFSAAIASIVHADSISSLL